MSYNIEEMKRSDWKQVSDIYLGGIKTKIATFQTEVPTWEEWDKSHIQPCRLIARLDNNVVGWASLSKTSDRCIYAGVAEVSIYIDNDHSGQGIGKALLLELVKQSEQNGFWTLETRIIKKNLASIELHKKCGFREVGTREKIGKMDNGIWYDVVLLERRSKVVGIS